jgi:hypothetical protein
MRPLPITARGPELEPVKANPEAATAVVGLVAGAGVPSDTWAAATVVGATEVGATRATVVVLVDGGAGLIVVVLVDDEEVWIVVLVVLVEDVVVESHELSRPR